MPFVLQFASVRSAGTNLFKLNQGYRRLSFMNLSVVKAAF